MKLYQTFRQHAGEKMNFHLWVNSSGCSRRYMQSQDHKRFTNVLWLKLRTLTLYMMQINFEDVKAFLLSLSKNYIKLKCRG